MHVRLAHIGAMLVSASVFGQSEVPVSQARERPEIVERDGRLTLRLVGRRSTALQPLERQLTLRAAESLAEHLCRYKPRPGTRLQARLNGLQVVHSVESNGVLELVVELAVQQPRCEVLTVDRVAPAPPMRAEGKAGNSLVAPMENPARPLDATTVVVESKGEM